MTRLLTVMTRNLYVGASYNPVLSASPADVPARVAEQIAAVVASDFPARAHAIAAEIAETGPDIVGLQEATHFELPGARGARMVVDYLDILVAALGERGLAYRVVSVQPGVKLEVPSVGGARVSLNDREALLVRAELPVAATSSGRYAAAFGITFGGRPVTVHRGWVAVDLSCDAGTVRIVSTHLDPDSPAVQLAQARELTAGPGAILGPHVLLGDFNTWPDARGRPTYEHFQTAGFTDAWSAVGKGPGLTHGHAPDLRNAEARFTSRLDLVLLGGPAVARTARLTGHEPRYRTPSGLWPSDHAGVVVQIEVG